MSYSNVNSMLKFDNEIGTPNKPPRFLYPNEYSSWKTRFESFIQYNDPDLWSPFEEKYFHPTSDGSFRQDAPRKAVKLLTSEERKAYDREKRAFAALTMGLPKEVLSCFRTQTTTYELWTAIANRFGGNQQLKKSRKELLRKQFDLFDTMKNESFDDLLTRFSQLICELTEVGVKYNQEDVNIKLLDSLPSTWELRVMLLKENDEMPSWTLEDLIGKLQAYHMDMKRKEAGKVLEQDPSLYSDFSAKNSEDVTAFYTGQGTSTPTQQNTSGSPYAAYMSCNPSNSNSSSQSVKSTSSQSVEDYAAAFSVFMTTYEGFLVGRTGNSNLTDEDLDQIHPDDLEAMDLQWGIAMMARRVRKFLQRTGRKSIGGDKKSEVGFDKSKVRCYNCQNYGHFARECEKPKVPASGFTRPNAPKPQSPRSNTSTSTAMVSQNDENYDWNTHAEETYAVNQALMAQINEANAEVDSDSLTCTNCIELTDSLNIYKEDKTKILFELEQLTQANRVLRENEKCFNEQLEANRIEKHDLKVKILNQQGAIDSYITEIGLQKKEYAEAMCEILEYKRKLSNLSTSSMVLDQIIHSQNTDTKSKKGLGFHAMPPPFHYTAMPVQDEIKNFVPASQRSVNDTPVDSKSTESNDKVESNPQKTEFKTESKPEKVQMDSDFKTETVKVELAKHKGKEVDSDASNIKPVNFNEKILNACKKGFERKPVQRAEFINFKTETSKTVKKVVNQQTSNTKTPVYKILKRPSPAPVQTSDPQPSHTKCSDACSSKTSPSQVFVERRVCHFCGYRGHLIRDCQIFAKIKLRKKEMQNKTSIQNSSTSTIGKKATNVSPKRTFGNHSTKIIQKYQPKSGVKHTETTPDDNDFKKNSKLTDVIIVDETGRPKTIKAWVSITN